MDNSCARHLAIDSGGGTSFDKVMLINCDRIAYAGLLGAPAQRNFGSLTVYVSLGRPFRVCVEDGPWQQAELIVVGPYVPHRVTSEDRHIGVLMIEPESVDLGKLPLLLTTAVQPAEASAAAHRVRAAFARLRDQAGITTSDFDELFFGEQLPMRTIERRIAKVLEQIRAQPGELHDAETSASRSRLSFSRFLHLFADELGISYRRYRAWKRARNLLPYVAQTRSLTDIALEMGYPDSTHFSHSIRSVFGLRPKDIFAGSRRLSVIAQPTPAFAQACAA